MGHSYTSAYDSSVDALYVYLVDDSIEHTEELSDGLLVDVAADGTVIGVEVLGASHGWGVGELTQRFEVPDDAVAYLRSLTGAR